MKKNVFKMCGLTALFCFFAFAGSLSAQTTVTKNFDVTADSTWTVPTTLEDGSPIIVTSVTFEGIGGGGAGSYMTWGLSCRGGGGGGGGAYAKATIANPTGSYSIKAGMGGSCVADHTAINGTASYVKQGNTVILLADGGNTSPYTGRNDCTGALGGQISACTPVDGAHAGGNGADPYGILLGWLFSYSGGGGGAANSAGNGTNASDGDDVLGGAAGSGTLPAGKGADGNSNESGNGTKGANYGAGGSGATAYSFFSGNKNGGAGANGIVRVTYTYTVIDVEVENKNVSLCSGAETTVELPVVFRGLNPNDLVFTCTSTNTSYPAPAAPVYNNATGKYEITLNLANTTGNTINFDYNYKATYNNTEYPFKLSVKLYSALYASINITRTSCDQQNTITLKATATGGTGNYTYSWVKRNGSIWTTIPNADEQTYTVSSSGQYKGVVTDDCGEYYSDPVDLSIVESFNPGSIGKNDTAVCQTEGCQTTLTAHPTSSIDNITYYIGWQKQVNDGAWEDLSTIGSTYEVNLAATDFSAADAISFRYHVKYSLACDSVLSNDVYTISKKTSEDYTDQFNDVEITLWYGSCDTSIATLEVPVLDPAPVSIVLDPDQEMRIAAGENQITWLVSDGCSLNVPYTQKVTVNYPECGQGYTVTDNFTYETVRIGCECWLKSNLRKSVGNSTYFKNDAAYEEFGMLYTLEDAMTSENVRATSGNVTIQGNTFVRGACPQGWAIPTLAQYNAMVAAAGGIDNVKAQEGWLPGSTGTNASGFSAMAPGFFNASTGMYEKHLAVSGFWTSDVAQTNTNNGVAFLIYYSCDDPMINEVSAQNKYGVRCVKVELP